MSDNKDYRFDLPKNHKSIIKVIGVGGGGSNAVNHMFNQGIKDVEFVVVNTDSQALKCSPVPLKVQIGANLTEGLGAGANPERGRNAAIESKEEIRELLSDNTKMVFITAGMGGGTGTGAAPVIAKIAKEMDILTVGIVTAPFGFEGRKKMGAAQQGIEALRASCDTVLVILNDKLREIYGNLAIRSAFGKADNILSTAAKSIAEIITVHQDVNVDFEDVKTVMYDAGAAVMGSATEEGEGRAIKAAEKAIASPLLNNVDIRGAQKILLSIMSGEEEELSMDELSEITEFIQEKAGEEAEVIFGQGIDQDLKKCIRVTVIATGFEADSLTKEEDEKRAKLEAEKKKQEEEEAEKARIAAEKAKLEAEKQRLEEEANATKIIDLESGKTSKVEETAEAGSTFTFPINIPGSPINPARQENVNYGYQQPQRQQAPSAPQQPERKVYTLDGTEKDTPSNKYTFIKPNDNQRDEREPEPQSRYQETKEEEVSGAYTTDHYEQYKQKAIKRAHERFERLSQMRSVNQSQEDFKEKLETPAYLRKNVKLQDVQHSSEQNISKFNLNDDNEILGNNRFLHDNVD
ncbi:cell division protein FtsZ [Litoribacter ruber]|uniref:cell division protein FtsZ n=1 Tax=Litoribacter ruber TaxID=702568 RepID=UPI001BD9130C|nr:cell division protein FtsZ [Litoribacter ruber]MBT0811450.1 cell division protein FtsZ [Litoribacter ruber]